MECTFLRGDSSSISLSEHKSAASNPTWSVDAVSHPSSAASGAPHTVSVLLHAGAEYCNPVQESTTPTKSRCKGRIVMRFSSDLRLEGAPKASQMHAGTSARDDRT